MKTIFCSVVAICAAGCASMFGLEGMTPQASAPTNAPASSAPKGNTSIGVMYFAPAWGPDTNGQEVVYFLKQVMLRSRDDEQNRIYLCSVKPDGMERREITQLWKDNPDQYFENFSVAVTMDVNAATRRAAIGVELGERGGIFTVNLDGTVFRSMWPKEWKEDRPRKAGYPTWSPNGQWLAFHEMRDEKGFYLYRVVKCKPDGTDYQPLTERNAINYQPAWSPNGDLIAYVSDKELHLYLMKPDGTEKRDTKVWGNKPRWSPDGKRILHCGATVIDVASGKKIKSWRNPPWVFPKWGTNGYLSVGPSDISITDPDGQTVHRILENILRRASLSDFHKEEFRW